MAPTRTRAFPLLVATLLLPACAGKPADPIPLDLVEATIEDLQRALQAGSVTSRQLVEQYESRIRQGDPLLHSIIRVNPNALAEADRLDRERVAGTLRGPLHGVPIVVKDNIDVAGVPTTAGSLTLSDNVPAHDAHLVQRLLASGAIVLAKTNLSEWSNIRASDSSSGWSAVGGLTRNPYAPERSACGSSSGSGAAVAASFAPAAIGTETNGSIICPASMMGLVGLKPTVGLISRSGMVPISFSQDTAGPMARSVRDAALLLTSLVGVDSNDETTRSADAHRLDYTQSLDAHALRGIRLGVMRFLTGDSAGADKLFADALVVLAAQGAQLVEIADFDLSEVNGLGMGVMLTEFKVGVNAYLHSAPQAVRTRTLADIIAFNRAEPREMPLFGQNLFEQAQATRGLDDAEYINARDTVRRLTGPEGIDRLLREYRVAALIAPTTGPAWLIDVVNGDHFGLSASTLPAVAGYPHLTVPMGAVVGLPVGLSFIGAAWSEEQLLAFGFAFEQATHARKPPPPAPARASEPREH